MISFELLRASTVEQALMAARTGARFIAGGTTLYDLMRDEVEQPRKLVDINQLPLDFIRVESDELVIGGLARMSDVAAHEDVRRLQPVVSEALLEGASPQLRNMASLGGNLLQRVRCPYFRMHDAACNKRLPGSGCSAQGGMHAGLAILGTSEHCGATHPSDVAVALVAMNATLKVLGPRGERSLTVEDLFLLPGSTPHREHAIQQDELIMEVRVPTGPHARTGRYLKVRDRASYEFALVSAAAALQIEGGRISDARIACGGVGTRPWRMREAEQLLVGKAPGRRAFQAAGQQATEGTKAIQQNAFKIPLLARTVTRALEMAYEVSA